jgi:hypothetical protein
MRNILITTLLAATANIAMADELLVHTVSMHTAATYESKGENVPYNNLNLGIGYRTDSGWSAGLYFNSYKQPTAYIAKEFMLRPWIGVVIGAGTGYEIPTGHKISPIGGLLLKYQVTPQYALNAMVLPPIKDMDGVAHLVVARKF